MTTQDKLIPTHEESQEVDVFGLPVLEGEGLESHVRKAYEKVDGQISQQSLADSFKAFYTATFAYDWSEGRWYRHSVHTWIRQHSIMDAIAEWTRHMVNMAGSTASVQAKWLNAANYSGIETLLRSMCAAEFNIIKNLIAFTNGYALNTDGGSIDRIYAAYHINRYLPEGVNGNFDKVSAEFDNNVWDALSHYTDIKDRFAVKDYFQQWFGSALSGDSRDEAMLFIAGPPGSGKSTIVEAIAKAFGDYAASVYGGKVAKEGNSHLEWLARLEGKRLVTITELPDKGTWQTDTLNDLVGGGKIVANRMRQDTTEFVSTAHVVATGNSRPRAAGGSGIWRRIKIIHFDNKPEKVDKTLKEKFGTVELPGIMAWLLKGLDKWNDNGRTLTTPAIIESDVQEYQESSEPVAKFISEKCAMGGTGSVTARELYDAYHAWYTTDVGDKPLSIRRFGTTIRELGIEPPVSINKVKVYKGMEIVPTN